MASQELIAKPLDSWKLETVEDVEEKKENLKTCRVVNYKRR